MCLSVQNDKKQISDKHAQRVSITAVMFRGGLSINQAILNNIYLRTEITGDLCGVFDKTDAQL